MGVFGSSDSSESKKLEADIGFIKTRLDLIAKQLAGGAGATTGSSTPADLDAKLRAIYTAVQNLGPRIDASRSSDRVATPAAPLSFDPQVLDTIATDLKQLLGRSDRTTHLELTQRLDAIEERLRVQQQTMQTVASALRDIIGELRKR